MFFKIKQTIKDLAKNAVFIAEEKFGHGNGYEKKEMAINYIINKLPLAPVIKEIVSLFLSDFIDNAIEAAVLYMNSLPKNKEKQ